MIFTGSGYVYNDFLKNFSDTSYAINYDDEPKVFYLVTANFMTTGWIVLTNNDLQTLRNNLNKYLDWEKLAVGKKVKIEKELPNSEIETRVVWKFGDDWYQADGVQLTFTFFSQSELTHQLVVGSNKVSSPKNEYVSFKLDQLYLQKDQVLVSCKRKLF